MLVARDLSVHLFNSYALGKKKGGHEHAGGGAGNGLRLQGGWAPAGDWTAWPMGWGVVPRWEDGGYGEDGDRSGMKARDELRGLLLAHITKVARERFVNRACEEGCDGVHSYTIASQIQTGPTVRSSAEPEDLDSAGHKVVVKRSTSQVSGVSSKRSRSRKRKRDGSEEGVEMEPVPIVDDVRAMRIAGPGIEHVISSLERLLGGLGVARRAYFSQRKGPSRVRRGRSSGAASKSRASSRVSKRDTSGSQETSSEEDDRESEAEPSEESEDEVEKKSAKAASQLRSLQRYGRRDWKDILGLATILGWDEQALRRTRDRCAILFGESVPMDNLDLNPVRTETDLLASEDEMEDGVHVDGYLRPIKHRFGRISKNKKRGNWKSRAKAKRMEQAQQASDMDDMPLHSIEHLQDAGNTLQNLGVHLSKPTDSSATSSGSEERAEPPGSSAADSSLERQSSSSSS